MSKLKLLILIVVLVGGIAYGISYLNQQLSPTSNTPSDSTSKTASGITYYNDPSGKYVVAKFDKPIELQFTDKNAQSLKEQSVVESYVLAFNASYFRGSYISSEHAGLLQIDGEVIEPLAIDKQVTHIAVYDKQTDFLSFQPAVGFELENYASEDYTLFQTGPLVLVDNQLQTDLIDNSLNGNGKYLRTLLGHNNKGEKFVVVTKVNYTLAEIAAEVLKLDLFKGETLSIVNLDGGASTAIYSKDLDQISFGESKRLPVIIGVE